MAKPQAVMPTGAAAALNDVAVALNDVARSLAASLGPVAVAFARAMAEAGAALQRMPGMRSCLLQRMQPEREWPAEVTRLAQALRDGQDCHFALHDALLEAGAADLAEHFRSPGTHHAFCPALLSLVAPE